MDDARKEFAMIQAMGQRAVADLPTHRALVEKMRAR
jgi:tryptophan halogenase